MAKNRVSRKSLKEPDEFITFSTRLIQQIILYKTKIAVAIGVLVGVVILISGVSYFSEQAENRGSLSLARVMDHYDTLVKTDGPEKACAAVQGDFEALLSEYSGKNCGRFARLAFANISYRAGKYDQAVELFSRAVVDFNDVPLMKNIATCALAYALEEKKDYEKAAGYFETLAADPDVIMGDEALFALGRMYGLLEKTDKRVEAWGKLIDNHPNSIYAPLVTGEPAG